MMLASMLKKLRLPRYLYKIHTFEVGRVVLTLMFYPFVQYLHYLSGHYPVTRQII
jgi:hypothetical protein